MPGFEYLPGDNLSKVELDRQRAQLHESETTTPTPEPIYVVGFTRLLKDDAHILTLPDRKLPVGNKSEHTSWSIEREAYKIAQKAGFIKPSAFRALHIERELLDNVHGYSFQVVVNSVTNERGVASAIPAGTVKNFVTKENLDEEDLPLELHSYHALLEAIDGQDDRKYDAAFLRAFGAQILKQCR